MKKTYEKNKKLIRLVFTLLIVFLIVKTAKSEILSININDLRKIKDMVGTRDIILSFLVGLLLFAPAVGYDLIGGKDLGLSFRKRALIGWICQTFNNFAGFGGITGGSLRKKFYEQENIDSDQALKISLKVWISNGLGLLTMFFMAIPYIIREEKWIYLFLMLVPIAYVLFYFFGYKLPGTRFGKLREVSASQSYGEKTQMVLMSSFEWWTAAIYFGYCVKLFAPQVSIWDSYMIYVVAIIVGLLSFIPGGIGSFDLIIMLYFKTLGVGSESVFLALLMYRIGYYIIPWILGIVLLLLNIPQDEENIVYRVIAANMTRKIIALGVFVSGIILVYSSLKTSIISSSLLGIIPLSVIQTTRRYSFVIGISFVALSRGIYDGTKRSFVMTVILLPLSAIFLMMKGMSYREPVFMLVLALVLLITRKQFYRQTHRISLKEFFITFGLLLLSTFIVFTIFYASNIRIDPMVNNNRQKILLIVIVTFVISISFLYGRTKRIEFKKINHDDIREFEDFIKDYPSNEYTSLFYLRDKNMFFNEKKTVMFLYKAYSNHIMVLGDPVGKKEDFEKAIDELVNWAAEYHMDVSFYEVSSKNLSIYADQGFSFIKQGMDAIVDLEDFTIAGKKNKSLRHALNYMEKFNIYFEIVEPPFSDDFYQEIREISDDWLGSKKEMGYSLGGFDDFYIKRNPIAVLRSDEKIEGFATFLPIPNTRKFSIDLMRFRKDSPNGVMDSLFINLMLWAKDQGYKEFILGMAPLANVGGYKYSRYKENILKYVYDFGEKVYGFKGLKSYKEKFNPRWESRYLIYKNDRILPSLLFSYLTIIHNPKNGYEKGEKMDYDLYEIKDL